MAPPNNFRKLLVPEDGGVADSKQQDFSQTFANVPVTTHFIQWKRALLGYIEKYPAIFGCVAWLTDPDILAALAAKKTQIVVQKEDFLRPDGDDDSPANEQLRRQYALLTPIKSESSDPVEVLQGISLHSGEEWGAVRCVGNCNSARHPSMPRMHNKMLIFADLQDHTYDTSSDPALEGAPGYTTEVIPKAVWTGSCNFSRNASRSFENAVFLDSPDVAACYLKEFTQIYLFSEPLDWASEWVEPTLRYGS
jgi:phosphatidylserine/phosphatidylglycerophosphate/cardiolipin synthase-like enzyme